ncbi:MAG: hypothetical protein AAGG48_16185 [Planctomycetota bacterium]
MHRFVFALLVSIGSFTTCSAQETPAVLGGLSRLPALGNQSEEIDTLIGTFRTEKGDASDDAARKLIERAKQLIEAKQQLEGVHIARDLFLSPAPGDVRQKAYGLLSKNASTYLAPHIREIKVLVPNTSCYGRFHDSLKQSVRDKHDWVYQVGIVNTYRVRPVTEPGQFTIGTVAELTFTIDQSKSPKDLVAILKEGRDLKGWTMLVEQPLLSIAEEENTDRD